MGARAGGAPVITKDGVSVAKEIELADKLENMGAEMVRQVASKTAGGVALLRALEEPLRAIAAQRGRRARWTGEAKKATAVNGLM